MHATGVRRLVLAGSMVVYGEGRTTALCTAPCAPARAAADLAAGGSSRPARSVANPGRGLVGEDAPLDPRSTYAASKLAQGTCLGVGPADRGTVWSLRYQTSTGRGCPRHPYAGVASIFRSALASGRAPTVLEDGRQRRDFVHVTDVARANALAWKRPDPASARAPASARTSLRRRRGVGSVGTTPGRGG